MVVFRFLVLDEFVRVRNFVGPELAIEGLEVRSAGSSLHCVSAGADGAIRLFPQHVVCGFDRIVVLGIAMF
jgi:hypothetical protein